MQSLNTKQRLAQAYLLGISSPAAGSPLGRAQTGCPSLYSQTSYPSHLTHVSCDDSRLCRVQIYRPTAFVSRGVRTSMSKEWTTRKPPPTAPISRWIIWNTQNTTLHPSSTVFTHSPLYWVCVGQSTTVSQEINGVCTIKLTDVFN